MIRLGLAILIVSVLIAALFGINPWIVIVPLALVAVARYTAGGLKLRCSDCGKRIKIGYTRCHHCGSMFGQPS